MPLRWVTVPAYLAAAGLVVWLVGGQVGREIFPTVDAGQFQLRMKAPTGTRIEVTEQMAVEALNAIKETVGPGQCRHLGRLRRTDPLAPIRSTRFTCGPAARKRPCCAWHSSREAVCASSRSRNNSATKLYPVLQKWLRERLVAQNVPAAQVDAARRRHQALVRAVRHRQRSDELRLADARRSRGQRPEARRRPGLRGKNPQGAGKDPLSARPAVRAAARLPRRRGESRPATRRRQRRHDGGGRQFAGRRHLLEPFRRPQLSGPIRTRASAIRCKSRFRSSGWTLPRKSALVPIKRPNQTGQLFLQDVARLREGFVPGEYDRYNMKRLVSMTANIDGEDLGRVARHISAALKAAGPPPRGVLVDVRGQIPSHAADVRRAGRRKNLRGTDGRPGPGGARDPAVADGLFPIVSAGDCRRRSRFPRCWPAWRWLCSSRGPRSTSNPSWERSWPSAWPSPTRFCSSPSPSEPGGQVHSAVDAGVDGAQHRLRPILMTSCAMIAGMLPMALAMGEGGEQTAPLGPGRHRRAGRRHADDTLHGSFDLRRHPRTGRRRIRLP